MISFLIITPLNDWARCVAWTDTRLFSPMLRLLRLEPEARTSNRVITWRLARLVLQRFTSSIMFRLLESMPGGTGLKEERKSKKYRNKFQYKLTDLREFPRIFSFLSLVFLFITSNM